VAPSSTLDAPVQRRARGALGLALGAGRFERDQACLGLVDLLAECRQVGFERASALGQDVALLARVGHFFARAPDGVGQAGSFLLTLDGERLAAIELGAQVVEL
jgi:hypothetical protein